MRMHGLLPKVPFVYGLFMYISVYPFSFTEDLLQNILGFAFLEPCKLVDL